MSNELFLEIYKKHEGIVNTFIRKFKNVLEADEIRQICMIALVQAYKRYDPDSNMKFSTYLYNYLKWAILREIEKNKKHKDCISIYAAVTTDDDDLTLADTLEDNTDLQAEIESKIMLEFYSAEAKRVLDSDRFEIFYLRYFKNMPYKAIEGATGSSNVQAKITDCRRKLIQKSYIYRQEYMKIHHLDEYRNAMIM